MAKLQDIAHQMTQKGKGVLAADESTPTCSKRFESIGVESTFENRNEYRGLLITAEGMEEYIGGVIMFDETLQQSTVCDQKMPFPDHLASKGVVPGIKVDKGTQPIPEASGELMTEGLDGLRDRCNEYSELGARFTKWRAVITIGDGIPTQYCIDLAAQGLARYAALSQEAGLVPIVEPEILMDGAHNIDDCRLATKRSLTVVFEELVTHSVDLRGIILKPNMVISGSDASNRAPSTEVARQTIDCLLEIVPAEVPGVAFLSGGQGDEESVVNLDEINKIANSERLPWELTYSYGRGLQSAPLATWLGKNENVLAGQVAFQRRGLDSSAAREGVFT